MNKLMISTLALASVLLAPFVTATPADATSAEVRIGMPFSGNFANSALQATAPSSHTVYFSGDNWSTDLYAPEGTAVKVSAIAYTSPPTFKVEAAALLNPCENKSPGNYVKLGVYVGSTRIGQLIYEHLKNLAVKKGELISSGTTLGATHQWAKSSCYQVSSPSGIHTHFEMGSSTGTACYVGWALGSALTSSDTTPAQVTAHPAATVRADREAYIADVRYRR